MARGEHQACHRLPRGRDDKRTGVEDSGSRRGDPQQVQGPKVMHTNFRSVSCALALLATGFLSPVRADGPAIAIRAGHLIDTVAGRMTGPQVVVVRDGRIAAVGSDIEVPPGARVIDLGNYTVL